MKIQILIPAYRMIPVETVQCLIALSAEFAKRGDKWNVAFVNGFNAAQARNGLIKYAVDKDIDYILWIDSDQVFTIKHFDKLLEVLKERNLDCLSAGYYVRDGSKTFAHGRYIDEKKTFKKYSKDECKGLTECDVFGFGFLLMTPRMAKEMVNKFPDNLFKLDCVGCTTEDVYFCIQAQSLGYKLYFDASNVVGHLMTAVTQ